MSNDPLAQAPAGAPAALDGGPVQAAAASVTFGYNSGEDRIVGVFSQGQTSVTLLLTRRLVRPIIARLAQLLDQSSPVAGRAPAAMRADVVQIEHQSAVAQLAMGTGPAAGRALGEAAARGPALLVARADLTPQPPGFTLVLSDASGRSVSVRLQWEDLHRLVAALNQQARIAQWDLGEPVVWLASPAAAPAPSG